MDVLGKAPNLVVVCATVLIGLAIAGVILLIALGRSTEEFAHIVQVVLTGLGVVSGTGAWLYAGASAKSGHNVEERLNGQLDGRIAEAVQIALLKHDAVLKGGSDGTSP